jgi:hypothetical protein
VTGLKSALDEASHHFQLQLNTVGFVIFLADKNLKKIAFGQMLGAEPRKRSICRHKLM